MLVSFVFDEMLQWGNLGRKIHETEAGSLIALYKFKITVRTILVLCKELGVARCPENMVIV